MGARHKGDHWSLARRLLPPRRASEHHERPRHVSLGRTQAIHGGRLMASYAQVKVGRDVRRAQGLCLYCPRPVVPGRRLCKDHLEKARQHSAEQRRKRQATKHDVYSAQPPQAELPVRGDSAEPCSRPLKLLIGLLIEDKRSGRPWVAAWNHRLRQVLAQLDRNGERCWHDVLRASHVHDAFRKAYLDIGEPLTFSEERYERLNGPRQ